MTVHIVRQVVAQTMTKVGDARTTESSCVCTCVYMSVSVVVFVFFPYLDIFCSVFFNGFMRQMLVFGTLKTNEHRVYRNNNGSTEQALV